MIQVKQIKPIIVILIVISIALGFIFGYFIKKNVTCNNSKYRYINSDLICDEKVTINKKSYISLKIALEDKIKEDINKKQITSASIYFRDLNDGPTLGIDEYNKFSPASLLKLPMLITYVNLSEEDPKLLDTEIGFDNIEDSLDQFYPPKVTASPNTPYKIKELLTYMIKYSDNRSYYTLREYLKQVDPKKDLLQQTFFDLGIIDPIKTTDDTISVKSYSSIFLQLYNNSFFLDRDASEQVLQVLSESDFDEGLKRGIPSGIRVAHKFGERSDLPSRENQLHDCGIIYYPQNPYLLCVMTRGKDFNKLSDFIGEVSDMVYQEFDSRKI